MQTVSPRFIASRDAGVKSFLQSLAFRFSPLSCIFSGVRWHALQSRAMNRFNIRYSPAPERTPAVGWQAVSLLISNNSMGALAMRTGIAVLVRRRLAARFVRRTIAALIKRLASLRSLLLIQFCNHV